MERKKAIAALPLFIVLCYVPNGLGASPCHVSADTLVGKAGTDSTARMGRGSVTLGEAVVKGVRSKRVQLMHSSLNTVEVGRRFLDDNFGGSLMQTLSSLPGVKAMAVGSGESKPVIRGLGFNRILVAENGVKHEGQQWGDDHGLEVDQYAVGRAEVIKGPAALTYGSDAIGGVINLHTDDAPQARFGGGVNLFARTNNASLGTALRLAGREGRFWWKANATFIDYADFKVPTDSIQYYSYYIKLHKRHLRNTAGREPDGSLLLGYDGERWRNVFRASNVNMRSGFFADAHGLEVRLSDIDYDSSSRDIDLPYHSVNHLFLADHTELNWQGGRLEGDFSWQYNRQREFSEPVSHGYMPIPPDDMECRFDKHTLAAAVRASHTIKRHTLHAGANAEYQCNRRGGWGFILPDFEQTQFGAYLSDCLFLSPGTILSAGVRYDHGSVSIHSYRDWYRTPQADGDSVYVERSGNFQKAFDSFTWSVGIDRSLGRWALKANVGKSFRMPIAKELGMDGVNYSIFRYEQGNSDLKPEESYQIDAGVDYNGSALSASFTPFFNSFPNYIYLNPTPDYKEGLQLYYYTQSRVVRWGFEASLAYRFLRHFNLSAEGEYLYARQKSGEKRGYSLPFSTPWSVRLGLRYDLSEDKGSDGGFASIELAIVGKQDQVVPPEEPTPGHRLLNASIGRAFSLGHHALRLTLRGENLLGTKYYDHTSYYRLIGVPEPGRNFALMAAWSF